MYFLDFALLVELALRKPEGWQMNLSDLNLSVRNSLQSTILVTGKRCFVLVLLRFMVLTDLSTNFIRSFLV